MPKLSPRSVSLIVTAAIMLAARGTAFSQAPPSSAGEALFDGKTLTNWQPSKFHGQGPVTIENGDVILAAGKDLTGITWSGPALPTTNYELTLQARRLEGRDFFAGVTFPVGDSFCSLILGGWGGTVVGLSSINGIDASENTTSQSIDFELQKWYDIRIRVTPEKIDSWLDGKHIIEQALKGNEISVRIEVEPSQPLGIASWRTKAGIRQIRFRRLN
jgi:Domain of Unknown Function (DUF1080)